MSTIRGLADSRPNEAGIQLTVQTSLCLTAICYVSDDFEPRRIIAQLVCNLCSNKDNHEFLVRSISLEGINMLVSSQDEHTRTMALLGRPTLFGVVRGMCVIILVCAQHSKAFLSLL